MRMRTSAKSRPALTRFPNLLGLCRDVSAHPRSSTIMLMKFGRRAMPDGRGISCGAGGRRIGLHGTVQSAFRQPQVAFTSGLRWGLDAR